MFQIFPTDSFVIFLFLGVLLLAAHHDVLEYRIPNRLTLAIAAFYPVHVLSYSSPVNWPAAILLAAIVLGAGFGLYIFRIIGAGDAKMLSAVTLWAGPEAVLGFLIATSMAGGLIALAMVTPIRFSLAGVFDSIGGRTVRNLLFGETIPYGLPIAAGGIYVGAVLLAGQ